MALAEIRAGSINLANYMPETHARAVGIANQINTFNLDVIGFQETEEWLEDKLKVLLDGSWTVVSDHVNCPVFVRSDKYERVRWRGKDDVKLDMPGSVRKRYGSMALVRRKSDKFTFVAASIHPSNHTESKNSASDRIAQAEYVWDQFVKWKVLSFPIMLLGDMNTRSFAPSNLAGVFVRYGMTDVLKYLKQPGTLDRAFVRGFVPKGTSSRAMPKNLTDHPARLISVVPTAKVVPPVDPDEPDVDPDPLPDPDSGGGPLPEPPPETTLARLIRTLGPITQLDISTFEAARKSGYISRQTAIVQGYFGRETTCVWSQEDEQVFRSWRKLKFRNWSDERCAGPADYESLSLLSLIAKQDGKQTYPIVR